MSEDVETRLRDALRKAIDAADYANNCCGCIGLAHGDDLRFADELEQARAVLEEEAA